MPGAAVAALTSCCALCACGGGNEGHAAVERGAPGGAPVTARHVRWVPKPSSDTVAARTALAEAKRSCHGKPPRQVVMTYRAEARKRGVPAGVLARAVRIPSAQSAGKPGHALLAGAVYAYSRPASRRQDAAAGCVYELQKSLSNRRSMKGASR